MNINEAVEKLATEGDAKQIATFLAQQGCIGYTQNQNSCPVARYLQRSTGQYIEVGKTIASVRELWAPGAPGHYTTIATVPLPENVSEFVADFDSGEFPELDAEHESTG